MPVTTSLDHLITALRGRSESARRAAVEALVAQGSAAVKPLRDALADPHWEVRRAAVQALVRIGDLQATVAALRVGRQSHVIHLQRAALETLEALGNIGRREALPVLQAYLKGLRRERDQNVLTALRAAIEKIEKATAATAGLPRAAEAETPTPTGRPRAAADAPTAEGRPRTTSDQ
jgi:HEAT repeat protein